MVEDNFWNWLMRSKNYIYIKPTEGLPCKNYIKLGLVCQGFTSPVKLFLQSKPVGIIQQHYHILAVGLLEAANT